MSRLQPQWANHTSSLIACFAHCILSSPFYVLHPGAVLGLPGPASSVSRERAGFSRFWWGRGCLYAYRATASAAAPCPAEPDACVSLSPRWDDPYREKNIIRKSTSSKGKKVCEKVSHFCVRRRFKSFNCCNQICSRRRVKSIIRPGWHGSRRWIQDENQCFEIDFRHKPKPELCCLWKSTS